MKNIDRFCIVRLALALAFAFTVSSCEKEEIIGMAKPNHTGEYISFNIQQGWPQDQNATRSGKDNCGKLQANYILMSEDNTQSLKMSAYEQTIDTWFDVQTRGTMIESSAFNEFMAFGYKTNGTTTEQIFSTHHQINGGMWERPVGAQGSGNEDGYYWPGSDYTCSFFGIAMSDGKLTDTGFYDNVTTTTNDAGQIIAFDYTVPDSATDQPDIMVASATNLAGDGSEGAVLAFNHIMTAINIKAGSAVITGQASNNLTIESITLNNIYAKGTYTIATNAWSNTVFYNEQESYSVDFNGTETGNGTYESFEDKEGNIMNGTGATLMLMPQTLRNDATITVKYTLNGTPTTTTANIGGTVWESGKVLNYVLNINNTDGVEFITIDSYQDAHYIIMPLNIKCQNKTATLRAIDSETGETANWVQFRSALVEVENDGWWADPTEIYNVDQNGNQTEVNNSDYTRSNTLTITTGGQYFAFLTENIGTANREVKLQLIIGNTVEDEITVTQLCPTWNGDGTKGCERIEEGEPLPWGYSWKLKEGETEYKTTVTVPSKYLMFIDYNRIFAWIMNALNGEPAKSEGNGKYTFDYTDFINEMADPNSGAGSTSDGKQNTTYMYSYAGGGSMVGLYTYFIDNLDAEKTSTTFEGISYTEYATKEALKKNKVRVNIGKENATNQEIHNPIIESSRTDLWYLPATGEVSILQNNANIITDAETMMNAGDIFWTSTADETPNAFSYIFGNPGTTQSEDRDNPHRVRAIRAKTN